MKEGSGIEGEKKKPIVLIVGNGGESIHKKTMELLAMSAVCIPFYPDRHSVPMLPDNMHFLPRGKKFEPCGNPDCGNLTAHNKGFCSAECFKIMKEKK